MKCESGGSSISLLDVTQHPASSCSSDPIFVQKDLVHKYMVTIIIFSPCSVPLLRARLPSDEPRCFVSEQCTAGTAESWEDDDLDIVTARSVLPNLRSLQKLRLVESQCFHTHTILTYSREEPCLKRPAAQSGDVSLKTDNRGCG